MADQNTYAWKQMTWLKDMISQNYVYWYDE